MTTKKELLAKIAELQAQADSMPDEFKIDTARAYEPLSLSEPYWMVSVEGAVLNTRWNDGCFDLITLESGQIFLTKKSARRESQRRNLWHSCRKAMKEAWEARVELPNWTDKKQVKYCVFVERESVNFGLFHTQYQKINFPNMESLEAWHSTVTDDDIKLMLIEEW